MQSYQPDSCCDEGSFGVSGSSKVFQVGLCWVSYQPELCPWLTDDGLLVLSSLSKNITGSLMTQEKTCVLCSLPGSTCFFSSAFWRMTENFHLEQSMKIA